MAMAASDTLRRSVGSVPMKFSFTTCWVMVEPPWLAVPPPTLLTRARMMDRWSMPGWVQKSASSAESTAATDQVGDLLEGDGLAVALGELAEPHPVGGVDLGQAAQVGQVEGQRGDVRGSRPG